jgi:dynein heavy chain
VSKVTTLCKLLESLLIVGPNVPELRGEMVKVQALVATTFAFCYMWSIGGNIAENNWDAFDTFLRQQFEDCADCKVRVMSLFVFVLRFRVVREL